MGWLSSLLECLGTGSDKWDVSTSDDGRDVQLSYKEGDVTIHSRPSTSEGSAIDVDIGGERIEHAENR